MSITVEYHGGKWMVRGVWNSTNKQQLMDRMKAIQSAREKKAGNHRGDKASLREIEQLRQQLRDALQENRRLTTTVNGLQVQLQGKDADLQRKDEALHRQNADLQRKDEALHRQNADLQRKDEALRRQNAHLQRKDEALQRKDTDLQRKDADLQQKNEALQQSTLQIQELENTIVTKDDIIQRNDATIRDQQREITQYRNNPHWSIQGEEVEITAWTGPG